MSLLAEERGAISGANVTGSGVTYTLGHLQRLRLETLTFTLATSSGGGTRLPVVTFLSQEGRTLAAIQDLNDLSASWTVTYTFGIGLEAFCGLGANGGVIRAELPDTVLEGGAQVKLSSLDTSGAVVSGDAFSNVTLYGVSDTPTTSPDVIPLLTPIALSEQTTEAAA